MKITIAVLVGAFLAAGSAWAQVAADNVRGNRILEKQNRSVGSFSKLHVSMGIIAEISNEEPGVMQVEAETSILPYVLTELRGDTLVITTPKKQPLNDIIPVKVRLGVGQLEAIKVDIGATLTSTKILSFDSLVCDVHSGARTTAVIDGDFLFLTIQSGSTADMAGHVKNATIKLSASSKLTGENFKVSECSIAMIAGCQAILTVEELLTASLTGSCRLQYFGSPVILSQNMNRSAIEKITRR